MTLDELAPVLVVAAVGYLFGVITGVIWSWAITGKSILRKW